MLRVEFFSGIFRSVFPDEKSSLLHPVCDDDIVKDCYDPPGPYHHLSSRNWESTAKVLLVVVFFKAASLTVACLWDASTLVMARVFKKKSHISPAQQYSSLHIFFDCIELICGFAVCTVFVIRTYLDREPQASRNIDFFDIVDFVASSIFSIRYLSSWMEAPKKVAYVLSLPSFIDHLAIVSAFAVPVMSETWLPFTFVRAMSMTSSARRLTKVTDLSELMEELAMAIFEFLSLVFTFACTIYMIETLGNPIGWYDADDQRLSFLRSLWFVVVTVSTVGYGDFTPTSILGRLCGMVLILVGVLFFGNKTGQIVGLLESTKNGAGSFSRKGKPHVVLTGKVTTSALRNFCLEFFHPDHFGQGGDEWSVCLLTNPIMAVNDLVEDNVAPDLKVGALAGSILSKSDAARAKISKAHACFILSEAKQALSEDADRETLLRALSVRKSTFNSGRVVHIYMHVTQPKSLEMQKAESNFRGLCSTSLRESMLSKSMVCPGVVPLISNLISSCDENLSQKLLERNDREKWMGPYLRGAVQEIYTVKIRREVFQNENLTFGDVVLALHKESITLFALGTFSDQGTEKFGRVRPGSPTRSNLSSRPFSRSQSMNGLQKIDRIILFPGNDAKFDLEEVENLFVIADKEPSQAMVARIVRNIRRPSNASVKMNAVAPYEAAYGNRAQMVAGGNFGDRSVVNGVGGAGVAGVVTRNLPKEVAASDVKKPIDPVDAPKRMLPLPPLAANKRVGCHAKTRNPVAMSPVEMMPVEAAEAPAFRSNISFSGKTTFHSSRIDPAKCEPPKRKSKLDYDDEFYVADLEGHVVVLGMPNDVEQFLMPLVREAKRNGGHRQSVLFINDVEPSDKQWCIIKKSTSGVFFLSASPLNPVSIEMANVKDCAYVVMLADTSIEGVTEPGMIDSGVIFAYRYLASHHPSKILKCVMEIVEDENIDYLRDTDAIDENRVYTQTLFAQGTIFSRSISTTLLVQSFYNDHMPRIIASLLSPTPNYIAYTGDADGEPYAHKTEEGPVLVHKTISQEDAGKSYGAALQRLLREGYLAIALFRLCNQELLQGPRFVWTNPPADTMLWQSDVVFVLTTLPLGI